jgi:hypothetical protein
MQSFVLKKIKMSSEELSTNWQKENHNLSTIKIPWPEIVVEFCKDMNMLGWKVDFQQFGSLKDLEGFIFQQFQTSPSSLKELLYRMSISENHMGQALAGITLDEFPKIYASFIVQRSAERIELRKKFSD